MSNKPYTKINPLDRLIRATARCGMTDGVVVTIEFISGFELFNTRPYHNYETWSQGYRVTGKGVTVELEDLDDAIEAWACKVEEACPCPVTTAPRRAWVGGTVRARYGFSCDVEVKIIGMPATTFYCTLLKGHAYPHEIDVLGSDALNETLDERADSEA